MIIDFEFASTANRKDNEIVHWASAYQPKSCLEYIVSIYLYAAGKENGIVVDPFGSFLALHRLLWDEKMSIKCAHIGIDGIRFATFGFACRQNGSVEYPRNV